MGKKEKNQKRVKQGQTYSINTKAHRGHKGNVVKKKHNGTIEVVVFTHSPKTRGINNIKLQINPQAGDTEESYVLPEVQKVGVGKAGKYHKDMTLKNPIDKSVRRNLQQKSKRKKTHK